MIKKIQFTGWILMILAAASCTTVMKEYRSEGEFTLKNEWKSPSTVFRIVQDPKKKVHGELSSMLIPSMTLTGDVTADATGDILMTVKQIRLFTSWPDGWTEAVLEAFGTIRFESRDQKLSVTIIDPVETGDILSAGIRYQDDYYSGDKALRSVKNKLDRIEAVTEILKKREYPSYFGHSWRKTAHGLSMKESVSPFLFPELSMKKDPLFLKNEDLSGDATGDQKKKPSKWKVSETVAWNTDYTKRAFPEYLRDVRDSGTLLRDFEETMDFFLTWYNRDYYLSTIIIREPLILKKSAVTVNKK